MYKHLMISNRFRYDGYGYVPFLAPYCSVGLKCVLALHHGNQPRVKRSFTEEVFHKNPHCVGSWLTEVPVSGYVPYLTNHRDVDLFFPLCHGNRCHARYEMSQLPLHASVAILR